LHEALETARTEQAVRLDAVEEVKVLQVARLQQLADDLQPVFTDLPENSDLFICSIVAGDPPRLWIDMLTYVSIGDDGRTYKLLTNSRSGRQILEESAEISEISAHVVRYIAHRVIDRERSFERPMSSGSLVRGNRYGAMSLVVAWTCGFAVGALVLFALGVMIYGRP